jgi:hypothetical protein
LFVERPGVADGAAERLGGEGVDAVARDGEAAGVGGFDHQAALVEAGDGARQAVAADHPDRGDGVDAAGRAAAAEHDLACLVGFEFDCFREVRALPCDAAAFGEAGEAAVELVAVGEAEQVVGRLGGGDGGG